MRQNGLQSRKQLEFLHEEFDNICETVKKSKQSKLEARNDNLNKGLKWCIPYTVITFCANRIKELTANPQEVEKWQLLAWIDFKQIIFKLYDHRIENGHEINGSANMNYCALNEYLIVYFME